MFLKLEEEKSHVTLNMFGKKLQRLECLVQHCHSQTPIIT